MAVPVVLGHCSSDSNSTAGIRLTVRDPTVQSNRTRNAVSFHRDAFLSGNDLAPRSHPGGYSANVTHFPTPSITFTAYDARDVAWADRRVDAFAQESSNCRGNPLIECRGPARFPPGLSPLSQGNLRIVHSGSSILFTGLYGPPSGHQFIDEFLTKFGRDGGITRSPLPAVDDEVASVRGGFRSLVARHLWALSAGSRVGLMTFCGPRKTPAYQSSWTTRGAGKARRLNQHCSTGCQWISDLR